jgi:mannose-6-phosphate isomerase-like protein (cupin superfamily)
MNENRVTPSAESGVGGWVVARMDEIPPVSCSCGLSRRAFVSGENAASLHQVDISREARTHWHEKLTEIYYVLEGEGFLELDGERVPVRPGTAVLIRPGTRHRAVGNLRILNVVVPPHDEADERFD